jgi:hypothetical protein
MRWLRVLIAGGSVVLLATAGAKEPVAAASPSPAPQSPAATFIPWLLQSKEELTKLPFSDVILYSTGKKVLPIDANDENDARVLKAIGVALDETLKRMNAPDAAVQSVGRINEVSSSFENTVREILNTTAGFSCDFPKTAANRTQRSGYPDLRLVDTTTNRIYYMDPKLFAAGSRHSSFRTFYFEPKVATNKVRDDAVHLILGIEHAPRNAGHWEFTRWDIVDLSRFQVKLKAEFQGSNHDMYRPEAIVGSSDAK